MLTVDGSEEGYDGEEVGSSFLNIFVSVFKTETREVSICVQGV